MPSFETANLGLHEAIGRRGIVLRGGLTFALGLLVAGCSSSAGSTPGMGNGGQTAIGAAGAGGGEVGAGGAAGTTAAGGAAAPGVGGADGVSTGGQGGGPGTTTIETCTGVVPTGVGVPPGTVVTASTADPENPATYVIDGDISDEWNADTTTGWITLTFPAPVMIGAVSIHADALPVTNEMYTLSTSTSTVPLGSLTAQVTTAPGNLLPEIRIPPALYSDLTIMVNGGASWVGINEVWLLPAPTCP